MVVALVLVGVTVAPGVQVVDTVAADEPDRASLPTLSAQDLASVGAGLPSDPTDAALDLVDIVLGDDPARARAATAELLRRSGFPLISADGAVIGSPDGLVLEDAYLYIELIPEVTDGARNGDHYTLAQLAELIAQVPEDPAAAPSAAELMEWLRTWGKDEGETAGERTAAASIRALSAHAGVVLHPAAEPADIRLGVLSTVLAFGWATSRVFERGPEAVEPVELSLVERLLGIGVARAADPPCARVPSTLQLVFRPGELGHLLRGPVTGRPETAESILTTLVLALGGRVELRHGGGTGAWKTHFRHRQSDTANSLQVEARITFDSGLATRRIQCGRLAGTTIPEKRVLDGWDVNWHLMDFTWGSGRGGRADVPRPLSIVGRNGAPANFLDATTDGDGRSRVELRPPYEMEPGSGVEKEESALIRFKVMNFTFPAGALSQARDARLIERAIDAVNKVGLPAAEQHIAVTYHGIDPFVSRGAADVDLIYVVLPVFFDVYSCEGIEGPWKGEGGFGSWNKTALLQLAEWVAGQDVPDDFSQINRSVSFRLPGAQALDDRPLKDRYGTREQEWDVSQPLPPLITAVARVRELRGPRQTGTRLAPSWEPALPKGEFELRLGGRPYPYANLVQPIVAVPSDPRCPAVGYGW